MRIDKAQAILGLAVLLVVPWLAGGKDQLAVLLNFFVGSVILFLIWRSPDKPKLGGLFPIAALGLLGWAGLSLFWSVNRWQTLSWVIGWFMVYVAWICGRYLADVGKRQAWINGYLGVATAASLYGFWLLVTADYNRLTSTFYWANPMAGFLLPAICIAVLGWADTGRRWYGGAAVILIAAFGLTASRGGLLALGVVVVIAAFTIRRKTAFWLRLAGVVAAGVLLGLLVGQVRHLGRTHAHKPDVTVDQSSRFAEALKGESTSVQDRLNYIKGGWDIFKAHPITGSGAGTFAASYVQYQPRVISATSSAHNFYWQTLAELGLVGGLLLVLALVGLALGIRPNLSDAALLAPILGLVALTIHLGIDIDANYPSIMILFGLLAGLVMRPQAARRNWPLPLALVATLLLALPAVNAYQSQALRDHGDIAQDNHDYAQAADYYDRAHQVAFYNPDVLTAEGINEYYLAAVGVDKAASTDRAESLARAAIKLDSSDSQHYFLLGRVLELKTDYAGAETAYRQAIAHDRLNHPEYYNDLTVLYLAEGKRTEAAGNIKTVLDLYPPPVLANRSTNQTTTQAVAQAYALAARMALESGDATTAKDQAARALNIDMNNRLAQQIQQNLIGSN